jgi:hypothetical protein
VEPLIFAHNTPMLEGFWRDKWWRVEQIAEVGESWISAAATTTRCAAATRWTPGWA